MNEPVPSQSLSVPLYRRRIVVTRPRVRAVEWVRRFAAAGADVILFPTFQLAMPAPAECAQIFAALEEKSGEQDVWLAVTSPTSAENLLNLIERQARDAAWLSHFRVAAVGEATRKILSDRGLHVAITSERSNARELASALIDAGVGSQSFVFHVSSSGGRPELIERLNSHGTGATPLHVSHQRPIAGLTTAVLERELDNSGVDLIAFASPSAADHLIEISSPALVDRLRQVPTLAVGPTTTEVLTALGFETITTSDDPGVESVVRTTITYFESLS